MTNALKETIEIIGVRRIEYGHLWFEFNFSERSYEITFESNDEFINRSKMIDREYDEGYGGQEFFGTIVFTDGTWITRGEYDGSEWWENHIKPTKDQVIPKEIGEL